jgi:tRNA (guanine-N(7)-)-methyltransferase
MAKRRKLNRFRVTIPEPQQLERYLIYYSPKLVYHQPETLRPISSLEIFGNRQPLILDLGCGRGEFSIAQAQQCPEKNYVGIDSHLKSLHDAVNQASKQQLANVKFIHSDLRWVLIKVPETSVAEIFCLFPPPVKKKKYIKKDVITPQFIAHIYRILEVGGKFHFVTDIKDFFQAKLALIESLDLLSRPAVSESFEGGLTRYQQLWEGHQAPSLRARFIKRSPVVKTG